MNEKMDLNAPKRGKNMFNYYISENRVWVKKENPTASSWGDIESTIDASTHHPVLLLRANIIIVMWNRPSWFWQNTRLWVARRWKSMLL
jgi:hypothetical protein